MFYCSHTPQVETLCTKTRQKRGEGIWRMLLRYDSTTPTSTKISSAIYDDDNDGGQGDWNGGKEALALII